MNLASISVAEFERLCRAAWERQEELLGRFVPWEGADKAAGKRLIRAMVRAVVEEAVK